MGLVSPKMYIDMSQIWKFCRSEAIGLRQVETGTKLIALKKNIRNGLGPSYVQVLYKIVQDNSEGAGTTP